MDFGIGLDQFPCERAVYASTHTVDRVELGKGGLDPGVQRSEAVQATQLSVKFSDVVAACADNVAGQVALAVKVVRDLGATNGGRATPLVDAGPADPALEHEAGGHVNDARPGRPAL